MLNLHAGGGRGEAASGGWQGQLGAGRCQAGPVALRQRLPCSVPQPRACSPAQVRPHALANSASTSSDRLCLAVKFIAKQAQAWAPVSHMVQSEAVRDGPFASEMLVPEPVVLIVLYLSFLKPPSFWACRYFVGSVAFRGAFPSWIEGQRCVVKNFRFIRYDKRPPSSYCLILAALHAGACNPSRWTGQRPEEFAEARTLPLESCCLICFLYSCYLSQLHCQEFQTYSCDEWRPHRLMWASVHAGASA